MYFRQVYVNVCLIIFPQVRELGNPKGGKKGKDAPPLYSEICEPCFIYLMNNEEIPVVMQAKLIKYRLLDIKNRDQKRRESEKKVRLSAVHLLCSRSGDRVL